MGQTPKTLEEKVWDLFTHGAYEDCVAIGNAAAPTLLDKLKSQDATLTNNVSRTRENLINILGQIAGDESRQRKIILEQRHAGPLDPDIEQALRTRKDVADHIADCLADREAGVRVAAINALLKIREPGVGAQLLPMLDDESAAVRVTAIQALDEIAYQDAIPGLMDKLGDRTWYVADEFLSALPAVRVCDHAFKALLNFDENTGLAAFQRAFIDGDRLLKAHAVEGLKEIKRRITDKAVKAPLVSAYRHPLNANTRIPDPEGEKVIFWDDVVVSIEQQGITKKLGELTSDTSPVIEEGLLAKFLEERKRLLLHELPDQAFNSEAEAELAELQSLLRFQWQRPIGCHGVQGLGAIRTSAAIRLLMSALESPEPAICADAISELGRWLGDFPDSGWGRHELILMTPEVEQLRDVTIDKLIGLLENKTFQVQDRIQADALVGMGIEILSIGECAAEALAVSGTDTAKAALDSWKGFNNRGMLPPT